MGIIAGLAACLATAWLIGEVAYLLDQRAGHRRAAELKAEWVAEEICRVHHEQIIEARRPEFEEWTWRFRLSDARERARQATLRRLEPALQRMRWNSITWQAWFSDLQYDLCWVRRTLTANRARQNAALHLRAMWAQQAMDDAEVIETAAS